MDPRKIHCDAFLYSPEDVAEEQRPDETFKHNVFNFTRQSSIWIMLKALYAKIQKFN